MADEKSSSSIIILVVAVIVVWMLMSKKSPTAAARPTIVVARTPSTSQQIVTAAATVAPALGQFIGGLVSSSGSAPSSIANSITAGASSSDDLAVPTSLYTDSSSAFSDDSFDEAA